MKKERRLIWEKSNGHCWYCGCKLGEKGWHADHFEPVVRELVGKGCKFPERDNVDNKVPACASCNILKGSVSIESFRKYIGGLMVSLNRDINQYKIAKRYGLIKETELEVKFWFEENEV